MNVTDFSLLACSDLPPALPWATLEAAAQAAAAEFVAAGTAAHSVRSYASALRYWQGWLGGRYGVTTLTTAVPEPVAIQFVLDHLPRPTATGWQHSLPEALDEALCAAGFKARPGPLALASVQHRLAVLAKWHALRDWPSPTQGAAVKTLLQQARRAHGRAGRRPRKKTAAGAEALAALLATCTDGLRGIRDRALLELAWRGGGRRRSEVVDLQVEDLQVLDADTYLYRLGATKTQPAAPVRWKPLRGPAAHALQAWLDASGVRSGPLFRRLHRGGRIGAQALSGDALARLVQRRAALAGLPGDWGAHSLRSGFVSEAARQGVPLGDVMAMTEHRSVGTVMGYFQVGDLLRSPVSALTLPEVVSARPVAD